MLLRSMQKYTKELADVKAEMMLCVMMLPLVVVGCTSAVRQPVWSQIPPPAWIMQPPDWQTPLNGIISPSERGWSLCKNNWKEPRSILMSSADRVAHIDGQLMQLLWAIHTRFQRSINVSVNKTEQSIYECLLGFCFNNIFCAATNFGCIDSFLSAQFQKRRNDGWWFPLCYCRRFVLNSKRLLSTSCNTGPAQ